MKKLNKLFFNVWYKWFPPPMVHYWKERDSQLARITKAKEGHLQMEIKGEKYPMAGFPRGHVLLGPLASMKKKIKDMVFNKVFEEIEKMASEQKYMMLPREKLPPAVRHVDEILEKMEHMEVVDDMKGRIKLIRKVLVFFLNEDDAYRFRAQYFLSQIDKKKIELTKSDKYYARGKYWKVDMDKFDY